MADVDGMVYATVYNRGIITVPDGEAVVIPMSGLSRLRIKEGTGATATVTEVDAPATYDATDDEKRVNGLTGFTPAPWTDADVTPAHSADEADDRTADARTAPDGAVWAWPYARVSADGGVVRVYTS